MRVTGAALLVGAALVLACAATVAAAPDPELARHGELVFAIAGCASCHSPKEGPALSGGDPLVTPFGTFYPPNITPDPKGGIGRWSEADLAKALREGRGPDGTPLYPAFPYTSYTLLTDQDVQALKAYLDTVPPADRPNRPQELKFPYSLRWGLHLWQWAFFRPGRFQPDPARDERWNRGAYLVNGPGHCQECHTPRNFAGALDESRAFTGAPNPVGKGRIPNITQDPEVGLGKWSEQDIVTALSLGMKPDGDFLGGEMGKVVNHSTSKLPSEDLQAIAAYLKSLPAKR